MDYIDKSSIRSQISKERDFLGIQEIQAFSTIIEKGIINSIAFKQSNVIMIYKPIKNEVLTDLIIETALDDGKTVCLPRVVTEMHMEAAPIKKQNIDLVISSLRILEPVSSISPLNPSIIDLIIIPGIAFDRNGHRIGFGKGFYDRFIPLLRNDCCKIAAAYHFQVLDAIPSFESDQKVDIVITEKECIVCDNKSEVRSQNNER